MTIHSILNPEHTGGHVGRQDGLGEEGPGNGEVWCVFIRVFYIEGRLGGRGKRRTAAFWLAAIEGGVETTTEDLAVGEQPTHTHAHNTPTNEKHNIERKAGKQLFGYASAHQPPMTLKRIKKGEERRSKQSNRRPTHGRGMCLLLLDSALRLALQRVFLFAGGGALSLAHTLLSERPLPAHA